MHTLSVKLVSLKIDSSRNANVSFWFVSYTVSIRRNEEVMQCKYQRQF